MAKKHIKIKADSRHFFTSKAKCPALRGRGGGEKGGKHRVTEGAKDRGSEGLREDGRERERERERGRGLGSRARARARARARESERALGSLVLFRLF